MPPYDWPASDKAMWESLFRDGDLLDGKGPLAHVRGTTRTSLEPRYGRWLHWIAVTHPAELLLPPAERVTISRLRGWLDNLAHTAPMTQLAFVDGVLRIMTAAEPKTDWAQQRLLMRRLRTLAGRGAQTRKQGKILSSSVLLDAGLELALYGADSARSPIYRATRIRNGAIIALLAVAPIRRRALANLRISESFITTDATMTIALPGSLTKSGRLWETAIAPDAQPALRRYLAEARPFLLQRGDASETSLWIGQKGAPLAERSLGPTVAQAVLHAVGVRVPPHYFRDAAATTLSRHSAQSAGLIRPILALSSTQTAERHYNHATTIEAGRDYAALLATIRGDKQT